MIDFTYPITSPVVCAATTTGSTSALVRERPSIHRSLLVQPKNLASRLVSAKTLMPSCSLVIEESLPLAFCFCCGGEVKVYKTRNNKLSLVDVLSNSKI